MTDRGCGSTPASFKATNYLKTSNRYLAQQVYLYILTGKPPGKPLLPDELDIAKSAVESFTRSNYITH